MNRLCKLNNIHTAINPKTLLRRCLLLCWTVGLSTSVNAAAQQPPVKQYSIPAQSLQSALTAFAETADLQMSYPAALVEGLDSSPLNGRYTQEQAIKLLLGGTGLIPRLIDNTITLQQSAHSDFDSAHLWAATDNFEPIDAPTTNDSIPVVQEDLTVSGQEMNGYRVINASTATKTDTPLLETPVSIHVIPKTLLDDQQSFSLQEALKNAPGVLPAFSYGGVFQQAVMLRGFSTEFQTVGALAYREGIRLKAPVPVAGLERIELLKGPATVLYGRAVPGGIINYIPKDPLAEPYYSVQQQFGSYDLYRTSIDATGPINEPGSLRYRLNLEYANLESSISKTGTEFVDVAPTLTWDITPDTQLEIELQYNKQEYSPDNGVPAIGNRPAHLSRQFNVAEGLETDETGTRLVDVDLTHRFNDRWKMHLKGTYAQYDFDVDDALFGASLNENTGELSRFSFEEDDNGEIGFVSLDLTGQFDLFGMQHHVLFGADYYDEDTDSLIAFPDNTSINIFNPVYGSANKTEFTADNSLSFPYLNKWWGIYLQDQIDITDNIHLLLGGRYDNTESLFAVEGVTPNTYDDFSPRCGIVYRPWNWLSLYASYAESFQTNNGRSADGRSFDPETAQQVEFGLKTEWLDGRLSSTLAFFELTKGNILTDNIDTLDPTDSIAIGQATSQGIELSVTGDLTDALRLIGQYAYTGTEVTRDNNGNLGHQLPQAARHSGSLWMTYDITEQFKMGAGVYAVDSRNVDIANTVQMPGYVRLDMMAAYRWNIGGGRLTTQLNVNNLLDKDYFTGAYDKFSIRRGEPLTILGSIRYEY